MARLGFLAWLLVVWVALWGDVTVANVVSGLVTASLLLVVFPPATARRSGRVRPLPTLRFVAYFAWKLVEASAVVAWEVVTPRSRITEGIVAVPIRGVSDTVATVVANAVSLTPGTLTLEVDRDPAVLYVHVLHLRDLDAVRREVRHIEALAIAAFGDDKAVARLEQDRPEGRVTPSDRPEDPGPGDPA